MPTSAPGKTEAGLTLVELMVVLLIVGMTASVVVLARPRGQSPLVEAVEMVERDVLSMREVSLAEVASLGVVTGPDYYVRYRGVDGAWGDPVERVLPRGVVMKLAPREGWALPEHQESLPFTLRGAQAPAEDEDEEAVKPDVVFGPDGTVTPFSLELSDGPDRVLISVGPFGRFEVVRDE